MDSVDLEVLRTAIRWFESGQRVTLATVVETWGSAPRPVGAMLAIRGDGQVVGSVSGGCVEDDLIARVHGHNGPMNPEVVVYGVTREQALRFGLPCGGRLTIVLEPLKDAGTLRELVAAIGRRELTLRELDMASGATRLAPGDRDSVLRFDGQRLVTVHGPMWRLLIIGGGQLSQYLAQMARTLDYHVIVCDPRDEYAEGWDTQTFELRRGMPDDVVVELQLDSRSAVVALTHDPRLDDLALLEALKSPAFYVGALGSRANNDKRRQRLAGFDLSADEIAKLHGPIGLPIGSRLPPEIAISILAEMTAVRRGVLPGTVGARELPARPGVATGVACE
jgi:xanthine dehydrogenase accessory factor